MTSDKQNKNSLAKAVGVFLTVTLTILFLIIAFRKVELGEAFKIIANTSFFSILLYLCVFFASHYARAIRWKFMLDSIKQDISFNHLFGSVMVSYGVSCVIPRLGEVYRALFLGKWEKIPRTTVLGTIVVERIIDIAVFAFASLVSVSLYKGDLLNEVTWLKTSLVIGFGLIFLAIIFLLLLIQYKEKFRNWIVIVSRRININFSEKLKILFDTLVQGFSSIKSRKHILGIVFWSLMIMFLYALNTYVGFFMLDMHDNQDVNFATAWIVMTISSFGALIPTPGGTGSYHVLTIFVLTQVYSFDKNPSAAYAILTHFISYVAFIGSTIIILEILNYNRKKQGLPRETFLSVFQSKVDNK